MNWYVDAAFGVHPDLKSHTGALVTMGRGAISSASRKQKVNTRSSTEAELIGADDVISQILWTKLFLKAQGYILKGNVIHRDNMSTIKLKANGKASSGKRMRHLDIKYFFITDQVQQKKVSLQYCSTDLMIADFFTKPLQGKKFMSFRAQIMNLQKKDKAFLRQ